jgi:hypothetical protein
MGPVDHDRAVVHGSMVDHGRRRPKGSSAVAEKEEEASGVPTVGQGGRCGAGGRPAMVDRNDGGLELGGGGGRVEARRGETESGTRCGGVG